MPVEAKGEVGLNAGSTEEREGMGWGVRCTSTVPLVEDEDAEGGVWMYSRSTRGKSWSSSVLEGLTRLKERYASGGRRTFLIVTTEEDILNRSFSLEALASDDGVKKKA